MPDEALDDRLSRIIAEVTPRWKRWLRVRYGGLEPAHPDLLQEAFTDLVDYLRRAVPAALSDEEIRGIGFVILKRRVADAYRANVRETASSTPEEFVADSASNP